MKKRPELQVKSALISKKASAFYEKEAEERRYLKGMKDMIRDSFEEMAEYGADQWKSLRV